MNFLRIVMVLSFCALTSSAGWSQADDSEREGGILGTGILGIVTALGSIHVNGQHILFDPEFEVTGGISARIAAELQPGHTVAVIANPENGHWRASYIRQVTPLVGPALIAPEGQLKVMGTVVIAGTETIDNIASGDWVAVSGLWRTGQVIASRIDVIEEGSTARIEGTVFDFTPGQPLTIGGTLLTGLLPSHIQDGDVVRAQGVPSSTSLQAQQLESGVFAGTPQVIFSEGYFSVPTPSGLYTLLGSNIVSYTDNPAMIDPLAKQFVCSNGDKMFPAQAGEAEPGIFAALVTKCLSNPPE